MLSNASLSMSGGHDHERFSPDETEMLSVSVQAGDAGGQKTPDLFAKGEAMKLERTWILLLAAALGCSSSEPIAEPETQDQEEVAASPVLTPLPPPTVQATPAGAKVITNSIDMKLTLIPVGDFMMGSAETPEELANAFPVDNAKPGWFRGEQPSHPVRITKPFYLGTHEITRGQFRQFIDDTGYQTDAEKGDRKGITVFETVEGKTQIRHDPEGLWRKVGFEQTDEHPVVGVSWNDATAFCEWLSRKEGKTYRLPTEAEWEYACRAGGTTRYSNGDDPEDLPLIGNVADAKAKAQFPDLMEYAIRGSDGYVYTAPAGKFRANGFGLYDMHGNVLEWCADWHDDAYYKDSPREDPAGPATTSYRVYRGGSWTGGTARCRSSFRSGYPPSYGSIDLGFRVALVPVDASGS